MEVGRGWLPENPQELQDLLGGPAGTCHSHWLGLRCSNFTKNNFTDIFLYKLHCAHGLETQCFVLLCFQLCLMLHGYDFKESVFLLEEKRKDESQLLSHHFVKNVSSHLLMICAIVCIYYILTKC